MRVIGVVLNCFKKHKEWHHHAETEGKYTAAITTTNNINNKSVRNDSVVVARKDAESPEDDKVADFDKAVELTGHGKFHHLLLLICGLLNAGATMDISVVSYLLPSAQCDFELTSDKKGWLNVAPLGGMCMGAFVWGSLADSMGRKSILLASIFVNVVSGLASSVAQTYELFLLCRFISGFSVSGAVTVMYPYLAEFQAAKNRGGSVCWLDVYWLIGKVGIAGLARMIIPLSWAYESEIFTYNSWRIFVALSTIPNLVAGLVLFTFPESPKYLLSSGRQDEALQVFQKMFSQNTGQAELDYPVKALIIGPTDAALAQVLEPGGKRCKVIRHIWYQVTNLFGIKHLKNTLIMLFVQFGFMYGYFTLVLWNPEIYNRYEIFESLYPNETASVCEVASVGADMVTGMDDFCENEMDKNVLISTLIISVSSIPMNIFVVYCVDRLGRKFFLVSSLLGAGGSALAFYLVSSKMQSLVMSCIFEATATVPFSVLCCIVVELFPTHLRAQAVSLSMVAGRLGSIVGNVVIGQLVDYYCAHVILCVSGIMIGSAVLSLLFPNTTGGSLS